MTTHRVVTFNPTKVATEKTKGIITLHGPQFRIPIDSEGTISCWLDTDEQIQYFIPVCGLRDNWVGFLNESEVFEG